MTTPKQDFSDLGSLEMDKATDKAPFHSKVPPVAKRKCSWKPKRQPTPTYIHLLGELEYMKNWVVLLEDDEEYRWTNFGCLYLIQDKGILWRNFSKEVEKYIAFGNMQYFRTNCLNDRPELETFFEVMTRGPIKTTFDKDKNPAEIEPEGPELASDEEPFPITTPVSVKFVFEPNEDSASRELQWHVKKFWEAWCLLDTDKYPKEHELLPPGRFADAEDPPKSRGRKIKEHMEWKTRVEKYGPPLPDHRWGYSKNASLFARGSLASLDFPRHYKIFRAPPLRDIVPASERFDEIIARNYSDLDPRNWWDKPFNPMTDLTMRSLRVAAGRYDDAESDTTMVCIKHDEVNSFEPTLSWTII